MNPPFLSGSMYHVYTHANGNENLFRIEDNYDYFLKKYQYYLNPVADTLAYCLMPNHFHFLIRIKAESDIINFLTSQGKPTEGIDCSKVVSSQWSHLLNGYTQAYNKMFDRRGSLFQPRIKRKQIVQDNYFTNLILYIHENPIKHGFVTALESWAYSSYHNYLIDHETFISRDDIVGWFGNQEQFVLMHKQRSAYVGLEFE
jgi:putative transposase